MYWKSIRKALGVVGLPLLVVLVGCDNSLGTVTGKVTYDGEAVQEGFITLAPADGAGPTVGGPIVGGEFSVSDIPPGEKVVLIQAVKAVPFARSSEEMAARAEEERKKGRGTGLIDPADVIPPNAVGNNAKVQVAAGSQVLDFALTSPKQ